MSYKIHPRAYPWLLGFLSLAFLSLWFNVSYGIFLFIASAYIAYFFRSPTFAVKQDPDIVLSPAWGKVTTVEKIPAKDNQSEKTRISIFLNIFDVHLQYMPTSGTVKRISYKKGQFQNAMKEESTLHNEQNQVLIERPDKTPVQITQFAGLIARRILCWINTEDQVAQGTCYGLIQFGSRVDVLLPASAKSLVKVGFRVQGGITPLARLEILEETISQELNNPNY